MEEVTPPKEAKASDETQSSEGVPDGYIPKDKFDSELSEAIKRRDSALKRAREAEAKAAQLEEESLTKRKQKAESEGNTDEQKKLFQMEVQKLQKEKQDLQEAIKGLTLETKVKSQLSKHTDYIDDAWKLLSNNLEVDQDEEGLFKPVVKSNPYTSVDEYIKGFFDEKPYLAKNPKKAGTGVPSLGPYHRFPDGETVSFELLDKMTKAERAPYLAKDKAFKDKYLKHQVNKMRGG